MKNIYRHERIYYLVIQSITFSSHKNMSTRKIKPRQQGKIWKSALCQLPIKITWEALQLMPGTHLGGSGSVALKWAIFLKLPE